MAPDDVAVLMSRLDGVCVQLEKIDKKLDVVRDDKLDKDDHERCMADIWTAVNKLREHVTTDLPKEMVPKWIAQAGAAAIGTVVALLGIIGVLLTIVLK